MKYVPGDFFPLIVLVKDEWQSQTKNATFFLPETCLTGEQYIYEALHGRSSMRDNLESQNEFGKQK